MNLNTKSCSIVLALTTFFLFLILVLSTVSAASIQNSAAEGQYACSKENSNIASSIIKSPYTTSFLINDSNRARSPVYDGSSILNIINTYGVYGVITFDASQFAAFYYDIDDNVATETLSIKNVAGTEGNIIGSGGIVYQTTIQQVNYEYENTTAGWNMYPVIGFFGEQYVPVNPYRADKLAKLVLDSDDKYTIGTGELLDLGEGYSIEVKQLDDDGEKVWLEFRKDGEYVDDEIISVGTGTSTWELKLDGIQGENDVVVLRVHVNQVFRSGSYFIAQIEGIWLIDYINATIIETDDEFGALNDVSVIGTTLRIRNEDNFNLTRNSEQEIGQGLYFKIADTNSDALRFYIMKEITESGAAEVRGQVATGGNFAWDASNFAGFYYDLNDNIATESLEVSGFNGNLIPAGGLVYKTSIKFVNYEYENIIAGWDIYPVIGFFGEKYVPLNPGAADKLAKLVLDSDDRYNIRVGELLDLGQGYAIEAKQIDVNDTKVWLEFTKEGKPVDNAVISVTSADSTASTWEVELDGILGEDNVVVLRVHVNQVLQGDVDDIAQIEGIWLIDYINATTIESDDEFGALNDVSLSGDTLSITNGDTFTLIRGFDQEIAPGLYFKVADTPISDLRYYPFVGKGIEENSSKALPTANFITSVNRGYAPLVVQFTDLSENATSRSWDVNNDGVEDSNATSFVYTYTSEGTYEAKLTAINENDTDIKTTTITVERKSSGGSSGGGGGGEGGGGGGSPEPAKNVEVKELSQVFITNGKAVKFDFTKNATCVMYVGFDAKKNAGKITTIVEQLKNKSTLVSGLPSGEVYKFFNLWVGNSGFATSENIENPVIAFKVEKSWVQDEKIDRISIALNRYSDKKWGQLPANLVGEDDKYLYFTAETPGFSPFAITGKAIASQEETAIGIQPEDGSDDSEEKTGDTGSNAEKETEKEESKGLPGFEMVYGVTGLLAVFLYIRK